MYVPLRNHGWHSLLTGVDPPGALLERAAELELAALALTDVDTLGGTVDFLRAAEKLPSVRPILGAEISDPSGRPGRVIALAADAQGYRNLCKLVSARQLGDDPGEKDVELRPERFDLVAAAERFQAGLYLLVDHPRLAFALAGRVPARRLLVAVSPAALARRPRSLRAQRRRPLDDGERVPMLPAPKVPPPARAVSAQELAECARLLKLATLAVPDVHCARVEGYEAHRVRTAIKHNALRCALAPEWLAEEPAHLLAPAELETLYASLPECRGPFRARRSGQRAANGMLARTLALAEACRYVPPLGGVVFPSIELDGHETPYSRLCALAFDGARKRYLPLRPEIVRRLDHELAAIEGLGFAPYFLLVKKIADFARAQDIPSVGRGSAADSLVAYCLELTDADPLRYRLPFERFLNPARKDRPDIDLDFCWRRRDEVLAQVGAAFGVERTAMIATLSTFGLRAAFREVALAEGLPPVEVNRWSRRLPGMGAELGASEAGTGEVPDGEGEIEETFPPSLRSSVSSAPPWLDRKDHRGAEDTESHGENPIARTLAETPECRGFPFEDPRWAFVLEMASSLLDCPRHLGLHPGGVVVAPGPITDFVACQRAAKGVLMTQLDKNGVEAIGLVKMDLLGNRALTVIDDCLRALGLSHEELARIPEDDERTRELLEHGRTLGCFQVESPGMRNLLQQIGARNMDDVIQAVALIRPGPAGSGMKDAYVRRFRGLEQPHAPHPRLTELLRETRGVMLYQEDVMQAVVLLAGFELSEADLLRRSLAKKRGAELAELRERFLAACAREKIAARDAARIWELIANFSAFGFCKAHAVTYGRIAYRTVWLKAHHPAEFLSAFLNSQTGYYDARVYVEEARRLGVPILPPDVNRSGEGFALERVADGRSALRVGLERVKGLSETTRGALLAERARGGPYLALPDFLERSGARADECERLILAGAFDAFDRTRPEMLLRLHLLATPARRPPPGLDARTLAACRATPATRERASGWSRSSLGLDARRLAPGESAPLFPAPPTPALALPALPDFDLAQRGRLELELLGLTVCAHPTALFPCAARDEREAVLPCGELARHRGERVCLVGWLAASRPVRTSAGSWMRFLTLEDESGIAEVVVFPPVYARDGQRLIGRGPFRISGRVEDHLGACTLHAERIG